MEKNHHQQVWGGGGRGTTCGCETRTARVQASARWSSLECSRWWGGGGAWRSRDNGPTVLLKPEPAADPPPTIHRQTPEANNTPQTTVSKSHPRTGDQSR